MISEMYDRARAIQRALVGSDVEIIYGGILCAGCQTGQPSQPLAGYNVLSTKWLDGCFGSYGTK